MVNDEIQKIDEIYSRYGYETKRNHKGARVYLFTKSIYNGADILKLDNECDLEKLKQEFSHEGYAVKTRSFETAKEAEVVLFKDFFKAEGVLQGLKRRYDEFVDRLMQNLPKEGATYQYIESPYEITFYRDGDSQSVTQAFNPDSSGENLISKLTELIESHNGPLFIILEAAAGYGKTCTAYEVLSRFLDISQNKIPFFTELSRDRRATIFSHILRKEVEDQFANRVDSKVVIHEIKQGRIPLIIDGFDELISKDFSFSASQFEQVESMLSTIVELLSGNAKVIITSRKTAIFNSEEFYNWMADREIKYSMAKVSISEPRIENWLNKERLEIIDGNNLPINQFANPVLLTFLKYLPIENLKKMVVEDKSVVDSYFDFLLKREQNRQNLLMEPETQIRIFKKLVRLFSEFDIKSASKEDIKDLLLSYNRRTLEDTQKKYTPDSRPRTDQLADTLSNHAFLDKKDNRTIGFVNEFIFGTLVGQNLITGKYEEHKPNFYSYLNQSFSLLAVQAFKVQPNDKKLLLWDTFSKFEFPYDRHFFFTIDIEFKNEILHDFSQVTLADFEVNNISFKKANQFIETVFTNCTFINCEFRPECFSKCSFLNCKFYDCTINQDLQKHSANSFLILGCYVNNDLEDTFNNFESSDTQEIAIDKLVLDKFFKQGTLRPRHRQLSHLKREFDEYDPKDFAKVIHKLRSSGVIQMNGDLCYLTKEGIDYYNDNFRS